MTEHRMGVAARVSWKTVVAAIIAALAIHGPAAAQEAADAAAASEESAPATPDASDLDSLLNAADQDVSQLSKVSVGQAPALDMEVSTVSRQESTVGKSPAAVFVITNEMIQRSGVRNIPDALRMAPGVEVARVDANKWAISIRGFNTQFANKLLVQIDGRTVYTPTFGGVYWDVQDVLLEDVERIEVIRGPGATVWGANAVNGVINILTKSSRDTQGMFGEAGGGTEERNYGGFRYGGKLSRDATYRLWGKWFERDQGLDVDGAADDWRSGRGGYRVDWNPTCCDLVTLQGDAYRGNAGSRAAYTTLTPQSPTPPFYFRQVDEQTNLAGFNNLLRWTHELSDESDWTIQTYYDRTERSLEQLPFRENRDTVDFDFQHRFRLADVHGIIWGCGYRNTRDVFFQPADGVPLEFQPPSRADDLFSYFIQDEITLRDEFLYLTGGAKFQHNDYTGFELQPTVRLLCTPTERQSIWASVSRAVRTPTRTDDDVILTTAPAAFAPFPPPAGPLAPVFPRIFGNRDIGSEQVVAYEIGMRAQPTDRFSWDLALFLNDYRYLRNTTPVGLSVDPTIPAYIAGQALTDDGSGIGYGFEPAVTFQATDTWRLTTAYTFLRMDLNILGEGDSARNRLYVQSSHDLGNNWEFDLMGRYVDNLPGQQVPSYLVMDARLAWYPTSTFEFYVVGRNLLDSAHLEFGDDPYLGTMATEVQREIYGGVAVRY
jgi:iron complex outermembrane receptor protein